MAQIPTQMASVKGAPRARKPRSTSPTVQPTTRREGWTRSNSNAKVQRHHRAITTLDQVNTNSSGWGNGSHGESPAGHTNNTTELQRHVKNMTLRQIHDTPFMPIPSRNMASSFPPKAQSPAPNAQGRTMARNTASKWKQKMMSQAATLKQ